MRLTLAALITILVLLSVTIKPSSIPYDNISVISEESQGEDLERVYGTDHSKVIYSQISQNSFREYIIKLTENGSRWISSPSSISDANVAAREWISNELTRVSNARIEVEILGEYKSVLGRLPGYLPIDCPAMLVGGHFDSVPVAPGANDDGTGVATMLELARVLSQYNWPLDIYFGAWNAEEIGLIGSGEVAQILKGRDVELLVHYNIDMLLVPHPFKQTILMAYPIGTYQNGRYWADLPMAMSNNYGHNRIEPISSSDFPAWHSSDHWPFIQKGYARSLFAHESGSAYDTAYHKSSDVWNNALYDYEIAIEAVKAIGASIALTMSRAYQQLLCSHERFNLESYSQKEISIVISGPTTVNVTCRWWGGPITVSLYGPNGELVQQVARDYSSPWVPSSVMEQTLESPGIYKIQVLNQGSATTGYELHWEYDSDIDGSGVPDSQEFWFDVAYFSLDSDADSLSDAEEMIIGTSWIDEDSDHDGMPDGWEVAHSLDPLNPNDATADEDGDTLTNLQEYLHGCNPHLIDSDSDQMPDGYEVENGLDPTVNDASEDPDNDSVSNLDEYLAGTDPRYAELRLERFLIPILGLASVAFVISGVIVLWRKKTLPVHSINIQNPKESVIGWNLAC